MEDYGIRDPAENLYGGVIGIPVENLYGDVIGEIKCLDLQFRYKGKWRSLDGTEVIDFQIRKNPSFDLVLGQDWLWMHKVKIGFGFSSKINDFYTKIEIDGMSIPIEKDFNKASSSKNNLSKSTESKSGLTQEEVMNITKKLLSNAKDNKHQKRHHGIFSNIPLTPPPSRRLNDDVSKNSGASHGGGKLSIKTLLNNIWKKVYSLENSIDNICEALIEDQILERLIKIEKELKHIKRVSAVGLKR
ncbi:4959_t:CDS:2 [Paraglomus occultum]|uniref:4959_t:CDS:1 n=1 Tax=Paraglomus occultum TaxID=144539 RepID=A0A9N9BPN5_9GLOM|nr:4959_t:CDS:2 [Paraglomus occultum]